MIFPSSERVQFRRQPVAAVWQIIIKTGAEFLKGLWPFILVIFIRENKESNFLDFTLLFFALFTLAKALAEYYYYRFSISEEEVIVRHGIFSKKHITLPLNRTQTVHASQTWLQKILGLTEVKFDSPGSETTEVKIQLDQKEAAEVLQLVSTKKKWEDIKPSSSQHISGLDMRTLFSLGLTANHFNTLFIILGLMLSFLSNIRDMMVDQYDGILEVSAKQMLDADMLILLSGLIAVLFISVVVTLIRTTLTFANFELSESPEGYLIKKGLLNTSHLKVSYSKIQYLSWSINWLRKRIPLFIFQFHTIGQDILPGQLKIKVPVTSRNVIRKLSEKYSKCDANSFSGQIRIHPSFVIRKLLFVGIIPTLSIGVPAYLLFGFNAFYIFFVLIYCAVYFKTFQRKYVLSYNENLIHIHSGVFGDRFLLVKWSKIQSVKLSQNLFQRSKGLADLSFSTAGGTILVPYIPIDVTHQLMNYSLYKIESDPDSWE